MTEPTSNGELALEEVHEAWPRIIAAVEARAVPTATTLREARAVAVEVDELWGSTLTLEFPSELSFLRREAEESGNTTIVEEAVREITGQSFAVVFTEPEADAEQARVVAGEPDLDDAADLPSRKPETSATHEPGTDDEDDVWGPSVLAHEHAVDIVEFEPEEEADSNAEPDRDDGPHERGHAAAPARGLDVEGRWRLPDLEPAALYGLIGEYALAVQPYTEACLAGVLISSLIGFGNAVNRNPYIDVGGTRHHVNENALLVGPTGTARKGEAMNIGLRPIRNASAEWGNDCIKRGFGSGEAIVDSVRDRVAVVEGDDERVLDEGAKDKRLLVYEDEFSHVITVAGREGSTLSSHIRNAWDSRRLEARTKGKALVATGAHVSILAGITPEELVRRLPETELANGFLNRFVLAAVDRSRVLPEPPRIPPSFDAEWADRFGALLAWTRRDGTGHIERDNEASELWDHSYRERLSIERHGLAGAVCSRAEAHVLRLSMIYALLDRSLVIRRDHLEAALAVWGFCEASVLLVFGDRIGDAVADRILKELRDQGELTREQIVNLFSRHKSRAEIENALQLLERSGQIIMGTRGTGGRPKTVVRLRR
jgi:hypothetical protein